MFPKWFWCTPQLTMTLPAARSPLTSPDPQAGWTQVRSLISRGGAGLKERNMRNRYPEHLPGRGHLAYFSSTLSLCPRTLLASFPDWTALLVLLSVPVGQAGMQQTGLAIMALAVCAALHASEGEWGHWPLRPPLEGGYLPNLCWKDWGGARIAISSSRNFQLISDYLPGNDIGLNSRSPISFRKEPHSNRHTRNFCHLQDEVLPYRCNFRLYFLFWWWYLRKSPARGWSKAPTIHLSSSTPQPAKLSEHKCAHSWRERQTWPAAFKLGKL